jgi:hypothetical protein
VSLNLPDASDYAMQVSQGSQINYSSFITLSGGGGSGIASAASSAASARSSAVPNAASSARPAASDSGAVVSSASAILSSPTPTSSDQASLVSSSTAPSPTSSQDPLTTNANTKTNKQASGGLSTGGKAGIGVGASIAGLILALGAFFLGMSVRKKKRSTVDSEAASDRDKPELDGTTVYQEKITPGLIPVQERQAENSATHGPRDTELAGRHAETVPLTYTELATGIGVGVASDSANSELAAGEQTRIATPVCTELAAEPRPTEMDSSGIQRQPQELYGSTGRSPVSPVSVAPFSGLARGDTYDDPRLVQNPWAQDDGRMQ